MATTMVSPKMNQFKEVLRELFQLNNPDLDFGLYRIMNQKREEVEAFLENDLLPQVQEGFKEYVSRDKAKLEQELAETIQKVKDLGYNPEENPKVAELRKLLASAVDVMALEDEVFSHLTNFFKRYYDKGDFISLRRYSSDGKYAIPYNGEEVKLHWANADQYYIKTAEYLRCYRFRLQSGRFVNFQLAEASTEKDNNKALNGKERVFRLLEENFFEVTEEELSLYFTFLPKEGDSKQETLLVEAAERILQSSDLSDWVQDLTTLVPTDKNPNRTILERHLRDYTARNTFDYFIHKDLGSFLRREMDFFLKNEVLHLDDLNTDDEQDARQYLSKVKVMKNIGHKIIAFLEQLENFQKKLWLKKKFVVETNYCFTLDRVPDDLYSDIINNQAQIDEWKSLYVIDELERNTINSGYTEPLSVEFLKENPFLIIDTKFFNAEFKLKLLSRIDDLDESLDGLLINSDNFQALNLLTEKYTDHFKTIYIDPPYNTDASAIHYKNGYRKSTWVSMMFDRINVSKRLLSDKGIICTTIDDFQFKELSYVLEDIFGRDQILGTVAIRNNPSGRPTPEGLAISHEYGIFASKSTQKIGKLLRPEAMDARYREEDEDGKFMWELLRKRGSDSERADSPKAYFPIYVSEDGLRVPEMEWDEGRRVWNILEEPQANEVAAYPIDSNRTERRWRWGLDNIKNNLTSIKAEKDEQGIYTIYYKYRPPQGASATTNWIDSKYSATEHGTGILKSFFKDYNPFSYPKSLYAVKDSIFISGMDRLHGSCLDYFAGSGTTGHAVIDLNRDDNGKRKYTLIEMGYYFELVTMTRIKKVIYSKDWNNGKPLNREGISQAFKYVRLESYDDTLNNLQLKRTTAQQSLLDGNKDFREDYMLSYMLDVEAQGSESLINIDAFEDPFNYKMKITDGTEIKVTNVDLVETFNYLLGLKVKHIDTIQGFRVVQGTLRDERKVLVIWRNTKEKSNEDLERFFQKMGYNTRDFEFDLIFVNGDNNLENLKVDEDRWKVGLIEEEFKRRMFDVQEV